ncbi:transposon Ty3-I Gag-Pol polyprotein [Nephila pilipes]|uniref:Transposon Ty3-I Gag-Pol polyprotein n=1 Tax=Nephila pilipes TaxID=299642 RepID=A0A8X6MNQ9_NEPPI|nr:transposon Ty3-I Gag-Pol polyprotein [Nephila pilipes]
MVDASDSAVGGVIQQKVIDVGKPLSFFSSRLIPTKTQYSTYDRELLAAYFTIKHFRYLLEGREFTLFIDHHPLIYDSHQNSNKASPRQLRHFDSS